jgi:dTDP-4-dehydrorhamnose reductase
VKDVLVTGSEGMLGSEVVRHLRKRKDVRIIRTTVETLDITDLSAVKATLEINRPTHIIHCAAFTQVDTAEKDPLAAYSVNAEGTKNLAFFAREIDSELIYISTDYVFDGTNEDGYVESDQPNPLNVYGRSKLAGERNIQILCERHKIVRTSWLNGLGGAHNRNFIETMLRIAETRNQLSVVNDQFGRPTFTFDLAPMLVNLLDVHSYGIFHVTGEGTCTWFDFACRIFAEAGIEVSVRPVTSDQFRSLAERPRHGVMLNTRFEALGLDLLPHWQVSLADYFRRRRLATSVSSPETRGPSRDANPATLY